MVLRELLQQYREMHAAGHFEGKTCLQFKARLRDMAQTYDVDTVLDYGSGKGHQHPQLFGPEVRVTCYDPAVSEFSRKPTEMFDAIICCDVLEHVPEYHITRILQWMKEHARDFVFISVSLRRAAKNLPDGRNMHITVKTEGWWDELISTVFENEKSPSFFVDFSE